MHAFMFLKSPFLRQCFPYWLKSAFVSVFSPLAHDKAKGVYHVRCAWPSPLYHWELVMKANCFCFSLFRQILLTHKVSMLMDRSMLFAFSGYNLHCVCLKHNQCLPVNKTRCVKASCLSKLISPVGLKVRKPNKAHADLLKFHLWFSLASLESTTHRSISA